MFFLYIKPWNKESERIFRQIAKDRISYVENIDFTRYLGRKYPNVFDKDNGFMDIGRIDKCKKSVIILRPGVGLAPMPVKQKIRFQFFRIF